MGVINVIVDISRRMALQDEASAWTAPTNYQAIPSPDTPLSGNALAPQPPADVELPAAGRRKVYQKDISQQSSFKRQTDDPRPWAKYL